MAVHKRALAHLSRLASVLPIPRPGESLPLGLPALRPGPLPRARSRRPPGRLRVSLRASIAEGAAAEVFTASAGGAVLTGWALFLGAGPGVVGLLGALPLAAAVLHVPAAHLTRALGRRRVAVVAIGASRLVWLPLVLLPFAPLSEGAKLASLVALTAASAVAGVVGNHAWTAWMGDLVPTRVRGRYFGARTVALTVTGTLAAFAAGILLDAFAEDRPRVLAGLAAVASLAGAASVVLLLRQHDPPDASEDPRGVGLAAAMAVLRDPVARPLVRYQLAWNAAVGVAAGFFAYHMLAHLRMGFALTAAHGIGIAVVRVATAPMWGRAVDRLGSRPVLAFCSLGISAVPAIWLVVTPDRLWPLAIEAVLAGALWAGHGIASFDLPFDLSPRNGRPIYLAVFATAGGLGFAVASAFGGLLAAALPPTVFFFGTDWTPVHALFLLSAAARFGAAMLAHPIPEPGAQGVAQLLRIFGGAVRRLLRPTF